MRFLLLSFLADVAFGIIDCGAAAKSGSTAGQLMFVTPSPTCTVTDLTNTGAGACIIAGGTTTLEWWNDSGELLSANSGPAAGTAAHCTYNADPMVTSTPAKNSDDNLWDQNNKANYELRISSVVEVTTSQQPADKIGSHITDGYAAVMNGESFNPTLYTAMQAGILGTTTATGNPQVVCAKVSRAGIATISQTDNTFLTPLTSTEWTKTGKCIGGSFVEVAAADELAHNTVGDGTKNCYHLPWAAAYIPKEACVATKTCDRFVESGGQCVDTTKQMSAYTKATANTKHCTIQPGAGKDDKYRHLDAAYSSQECTVDDFCNSRGNPTTADPICIASTEAHGTSGGGPKSAARAAGVAVTAGSTDTKWCIGATLGAKRCATTEVCNPHAATRAELCIFGSTATATDHPKSMAFGAVGAAAGDPNTTAYCIGDNAAGARCGAAHVCNYAGGTQSDTTAGGDVCLPHTKLLGTIADTAPWTAAAQKKLDGVATKYCLATDGTTFSSKECLTTEKCNPHASTPADVCKKGTTVMNHGDIAPEAADPVADSVVVCIGKSFWKACASTNGDVKEVCNEGAAALTDVCILTTDCVNPEFPMEAFREAGVEAAEDQKWCFGTDGAEKCGLDTLCNPSGVDGGSDNSKICADATKRVPHGEAATEELIHCYGNSGNAVLASDESEDGWLCDEGKGQFHDPKTKMEPRSKNETPDELGDDDVAVEVCFGKDKVETCDVGVYCNSMGTETGCSDAGCTSKNICITEESLIAEGEQWVEDGKSICINADATAGEDCTADKMYCDQTEGVCSAEEIASTEEPSSGEGGEGEASGCTTQSLAAAAVVAILSA